MSHFLFVGVRLLAALGEFVLEYWPHCLVGVIVLYIMRFIAAMYWPVRPKSPSFLYCLGWLNWVLCRDFTIHVACLLLGFLTACAFLDHLDKALQAQILADANRVFDDKLHRAALRWTHRSAVLVQRLKNADVFVELPTWVDKAASTVMPLDGNMVAADALCKAKPADPSWTIIRALLTQSTEKRSQTLKTISDYVNAKDKDKQEALKKVQKELKLSEVDLTRALIKGPAGNLLLENPTKLSPQDFDDLSMLYGVQDNGLQLRPEARQFLLHGWDDPEIFKDSLRMVYGASIPPARDGHADATDLWQRLGTLYQKPVAKDLIKRWELRIAEYGPGKQQPGHLADVQRDRLLAFGIAAMLVPKEREQKDGTIVPDEYELSGSTPQKALNSRYYDKVQSELVETIDKRSIRLHPDNAEDLRKRSFRLDITDQDFRSMIRGPIQLLTLTIFFTGLLLLFIKGFVFGFLDQWQLLLVWNSERTSSALQWSGIWQLKPTPTDQQALSDLLLACESENVLVANQLVAALRCLQSKGDKAWMDAIEESNKAAANWINARNQEFVFLDYAEYLLPALGFVGTLIGNGLGLGQANRVAIPDAQVESISEMTMHLGQSFYATLIALSCSIIYLFFRSVVNRLQTWVARQSQQFVRRHLESKFGNA